MAFLIKKSFLGAQSSQFVQHRFVGNTFSSQAEELIVKFSAFLGCTNPSGDGGAFSSTTSRNTYVFNSYFTDCFANLSGGGFYLRATSSENYLISKSCFQQTRCLGYFNFFFKTVANTCKLELNSFSLLNDNLGKGHVFNGAAVDNSITYQNFSHLHILECPSVYLGMIKNFVGSTAFCNTYNTTAKGKSFGCVYLGSIGEYNTQTSLKNFNLIKNSASGTVFSFNSELKIDGLIIKEQNVIRLISRDDSADRKYISLSNCWFDSEITKDENTLNYEISDCRINLELNNKFTGNPNTHIQNIEPYVCKYVSLDFSVKRPMNRQKPSIFLLFAYLPVNN